MPSGYRILPVIYDRWQHSYGKDYSGLILPRLLQTVRQFGIPRSTMVDIACGTGSLALMMARRGWKVWGIDASEGMIRVASTKVGHRKRQMTFLRQNMQGLDLPETVMLATSMFDSINHLLSLSDLADTFRAVYSALRPGGYLIFDTNNEQCFATLWTRNDVIQHRDFTLIVKCSYNPGARIGTARVELFEKEGDVYIRREERVRERCFTREEVSRRLEHAGFHVRVSEDFNFSPVDNIGLIKTWWVAQR